MKSLFLATLLLFPAFSSTAQEPALAEEVEVNLVLVDATVTDRSGNQILGLDKNDFIIKENGEVQEVASLDYFTNRRLVTGPEDQAAFKVERVREERYFVLFFHKFLAPPSSLNFQSQLIRARQGAIDFIENELLPEDKVAIAGFDSRLKMFADFTSDKNVLRKALSDATSFSNGITKAPAYATPELSIMQNIDNRRMMYKTGRIYDGIALLADALPEVAARTVMVLFTPGIGEVSDTNPNFLDNQETWYAPMLHALNRKNVSVYAVNLLRDTGLYLQEQTLSRLASETGGEYFRGFVGFETPLREIENVNNGYYMISYYTDKPQRGTGYQKIDVALKNPEFRVKAREGYGW